MSNVLKTFIKPLSIAAICLLPLTAFASDKSHGAAKHEAPAEVNNCVGSGPQAPRDVDQLLGTNPTIFNTAPSIDKMDLCNVHFHRNAEHKSAEFSTFVENGDHSGWACKAPTADHSHGHASYNGCDGIAEGDTIEVHWVHTSCDVDPGGVKPGAGLGACLTPTCANPELRVVAQVFLLQKDGSLKFDGTKPVAYSGKTTTYTGSTTGTSYSNDHCSPYQVTWDVRKSCETLDIDNFSKWCSSNKYNDNHAHGVRALVTAEELLSKISE